MGQAGQQGHAGQLRQTLDAAQQRLTRALLIEPRDVVQIIELADRVRRAERQALQAERRR